MLIVMADLRCGILLDVKTRARAVLATASGTHFVHDGFSDILYVLLPVWAQEFRLNLAQVGLIRTAYTAAMASFQIPAGLLARRWQCAWGAGPASPRPLAAAPARERSDAHVVGSLRDCRGPRHRGPALARVRSLLHALGRRLVVRADRVRAPRRRGRRGTDPH